MKINLRVVSITAVLLATAMFWIGCRCPSHKRPKAVSVPELQAGGEGDRLEIPAGEIGEELNTSLACILKHGPARATAGQVYAYGLDVKAVERIGEVTVRDVLADGLTYVKSDPEASLKGRELTWFLDTMEKGEIRKVRVWVKGERSGLFANCATLSVVPRVCIATLIGQPLLTIDKSGPATARVGQNLTYTVVVANKGDDIARNVVITDTVPDGLAHASGQRTLTTRVGDLAPGQNKSVTVPLRAERRGKFCNLAAATAGNAPAVKDDACTTVVEPKLEIAKTGTKEQFVGRTATYEILVANTGDSGLADVTVRDTAPEGTRILTAPGAAVSGNQAVWKIADLKAGAKQTFALTLTAAVAGSRCNAVSAASADGLSASSQACTLWKGQPAMLLETRDDPDPISVGETVTYTIRVTNQGTADDSNVKIVASFDKEIDPVSASTGGTVTGKTVSFTAVPKLGPKQAVTYTITAKGATTGDHRLKVALTSELLTDPVTQEESTHVY